MSGLLRADGRTKEFLGGPGLGVLSLVVVAAVGFPIMVSESGWSAFNAAAGLYSLALVVVSGAVALRGNVRRAGKVAAAGVVAVVILFVVGWTGIFSFSDDFRWSGLSASTGIVLGSLALALILRRADQ